MSPRNADCALFCAYYPDIRPASPPAAIIRLERVSGQAKSPHGSQRRTVLVSVGIGHDHDG
jgi:hypothetical protein